MTHCPSFLLKMTRWTVIKSWGIFCVHELAHGIKKAIILCRELKTKCFCKNICTYLPQLLMMSSVKTYPVISPEQATRPSWTKQLQGQCICIWHIPCILGTDFVVFTLHFLLPYSHVSSSQYIGTKASKTEKFELNGVHWSGSKIEQL